MENRKFTSYSEPKPTIGSQIKSGSGRRGQNPITFFFRKFFNYSLALLAYNCPFNSWRVNFHRWRGVNIGKHVTIGFHVTLDHSYPKYITIEDNVTLSGENYILTHSIPKKHWENIVPAYVAPVIIKQGTWVTIGAKILPGVTIGEYSIISAGSVVNKDIPGDVLVGGVPAKLIRKLNRDSINSKHSTTSNNSI